MYCKYCGSPLTETNAQCPSCGKSPTMESGSLPAVSRRPRIDLKGIDLKRLAELVCIALIIWIGVQIGTHIYNNSGTYQYKNKTVEYHGDLSKLYSDDRSILTDFLKNKKIDGRATIEIQCNDYVLRHISGRAIDVLDEDTIVYKPGLVMEQVSDGFVRFHVDCVFCISGKNIKQEIYFCSLDDVLQWIKERC